MKRGADMTVIPNRPPDMPVLTAFVHDSVANINAAGLEVELLEKELLVRNEMCKSLFLKRLFEEGGAFSQEDIKRGFDEYAVSLDPGCEYIALLISVGAPSNRYPADDKLTGVRLNMTMAALRIGLERFGMTGEPERIFENLIAAVIEAHPPEKIESVIEYAGKTAKSGGFSINAAYSAPQADYTRLPSVIAGIKKQLSHIFMFGPSGLINPGEDVKDDLDFGSVNMRIKSICASLRSNRLEQAHEQYGQLVEALKNTQIEFARGVLIHLTFSIHGALVKSRDNDMTELLTSMKEFHRKLNEMETIGDVNRLFRSLFSDITNCINNYMNTKNDKLVAFAQDYIRQHYHNMNLSLGQVADKAHITASYMGKLFKQSAQMPFSDFLKTVRLERSCELLGDTDQTINAISESCGFTNSSYFYNVFKKKYGVTPSMYRSAKQSGEDIIP
jgi:AraC-like DNA-binding protein